VKVVYVAGPFRGATGWDVEQNVRRAEELGIEVAALGAMPLIPHANTRFFHGTISDQFWLDGTLELLRRTDALVLVRGWERSAGATAEKLEAERLGLPVFDTTDREWWVLLSRWLEAVVPINERPPA
jgi:hypothetical protein